MFLSAGSEYMKKYKTNNIYNMGIDIGSTTVKLVLMNKNNQVLFKAYRKSPLSNAEYNAFIQEFLN